MKFLMNAEMKGRPIQGAQLQLEFLNHFKRHYKKCGEKHLPLKLFETDYALFGYDIDNTGVCN